ncbi:DUF4132 domain-containing protein [Dactylosporangium sp. AC04546]|uniref:DUF4132 domain-containing protein n=1 Tax=Dactylosporangium sp. AC04546 TaxID=2862460 RepID=UPI001EE02A65|nr:DUF4132 domain-containing protein [Dactylosporangium sp. AC04546]WVK79168.1 DUF4132 domain-containing protein [Dactylosporangium sp. AC04546]
MASFVPLLPPLSDAERSAYAQATAAVGDLAAKAITAAMSGDVDEIKGWTDEQRRLAALRIHADTVRAGHPAFGIAGHAVALLDELGVCWTRTDLVWGLHMLAGRVLPMDGSGQRLPAVAAARLDRAWLEGLGPALQEFVQEVGSSRIPNAIRQELVGLVSAAHGRTGTGWMPAHLLHAGELFGPAATVELAGVLAGPRVTELLLHCASLRKPAPSAKWSRAAEPLLAASGGAVHAILTRFTTFGQYVRADADDLLRGLTCVLDLDPSESATELIGSVALAAGATGAGFPGYPFAPKTAAAAVEVLARRGGDVPVRVLSRLSLSVKNKALLSRTHAALARLGALRGWQPGEVLELAVDGHGLDGDGRRTWDVDGYTAIVEVGEDKARLRFERAGRPLKGVPAAVKESPVLAEARDLVKQLGKTLAAERARIEGLLSEDRVWPCADWVTRYLDHPVSGVFARRLIWQASADGETWTAALPERRDGAWTLPGAGSASRIRLWHPALAGAAEVTAWRDHVTASGLRQPFKQAFREVYLLTPAEEQTRTYSNRFAAHILRYRQASALMRTRGWQATYLGSWDGGGSSEATKLFGGGAWRASFFHELADDLEAPHYDVRFCATDQVRFARRDGALWEVAPLADVPLRVFSEVMRDVDLFVGVTSIATDPTWADRGEDRFQEYWSSASFGDLTASAEVRRDALARILPKLRIAGRCELQDRYLRVRGSWRTYKIHLGSGNILMEPNDAYLCIVPGRTPAAPVHLPFDDDPMLSVILSKAMLLAADEKITDSSILRQLSLT